MKTFPIGLIIFGIILIIFPDLIAYLFGGFLIFLGFAILILFKGKKGKGDNSYVKFGDYKIYK